MTNNLASNTTPGQFKLYIPYSLDYKSLRSISLTSQLECPLKAVSVKTTNVCNFIF